MADNVTLPGTGAVVATDERSIASTNVEVQRIASLGTPSFNPDQLAPTSTATSASIAARDTRKRLVIYNNGTLPLYVSERATNAGTPATTTAHSVPLPVMASMELHITAAVYIFTASGTGACSYWEEYD